MNPSSAKWARLREAWAKESVRYSKIKKTRKPLSTEHKAKLRFARLGKKHSDQSKLRISLSCKGRDNSNPDTNKKRSESMKLAWQDLFKKTAMMKAAQKRRGQKMNQEHRARLSSAKKQMWADPKTKARLVELRNQAEYLLKFQGENNPNWQGGLSFEPYTQEFSRMLKRAIRARDGFSCRICKQMENGRAHHIHHIDYNKKNNHPGNLAALCLPCHGKTNFQRAYWKNFFTASAIKSNEEE